MKHTFLLTITAVSLLFSFSVRAGAQENEKSFQDAVNLYQNGAYERARAIFEELGDVIFVLCRIANLFDMDVETATKHSVDELKRRFLYLEEKYGADKIKTASQEEFFKFWKEAKGKK